MDDFYDPPPLSVMDKDAWAQFNKRFIEDAWQHKMQQTYGKSPLIKEKLIWLFHSYAKETAKLSHATRSKVGCVIVKNGNVLSFGYNGMPKGFDNNCEIDNVTRKEVLHGESNALMKLLNRGGESAEGASIFVTLSPCFDCAKLIVQAGIKEVYFSEYYRNTESLGFLLQAGVALFYINEKDQTIKNIYKVN